MRIRHALLVVGAALAALHWSTSARARAQEPLPLHITSPHGRIATTGLVRIVAQIAAEHVPEGAVVRFFVDDALIGEDAAGPVYAAEWNDTNPFLPATIRAEVVAGGAVAGLDTVALPGLEVTDETSVTTVLMDVAVLDEQGRHVRGLTRDHFAIYEDGTSQLIDVMDAATVPTTYTLLVDTSQSMSYRFDFVRRAARKLGSRLREQDHMVVLPFALTLGTLTGPTTDLATVASAVDELKSSGGTAIADALAGAAERLTGVQGRHIIVLLTDGYDEHSEVALDEAIAAARRLHATLYTVGIAGSAGISIRGREVLKRLASETGGLAFFPYRDDDLPSVQERVATDVAERYLLSYTPANQERDGLWRQVEVKTGEPSFTVKARDGYFAAAPLPIKPTIEFTVRDTLRRAVTIDAQDLIVHEDGVEQTLTSFQEAVAPLSIVMALDKSGSMRREEEAVRAAAGAFIDALRLEDALGVVGFSDGAEILADVATYRTWSGHAVKQYKTAGGTALYDGIDLALERLEQVQGRAVLVLMTDGRDENNAGNGPGSQRTLDTVLDRLSKSSVTVFPIGLGANVDRDIMQRLAQMTGGEAYFPDDVTKLAGYYERVIEDLRRRYVLGYTSTNAKHDGGWRQVDVQSRRDGLVISSRGGYQAPSK